MNPGLIVGVVGAAAGVVAVLIAILQLRRTPAPSLPLPSIEPMPDSIVHGVRTAASGVHVPAPSAADFGLPVRVLTERLPKNFRTPRLECWL